MVAKYCELCRARIIHPSDLKRARYGQRKRLASRADHTLCRRCYKSLVTRSIVKNLKPKGDLDARQTEDR